MKQTTNIVAVTSFMKKHRFSDGEKQSINITVQIESTVIYNGEAAVYFLYNYGYSQYDIEIMWNFSDEFMCQNSLHGKYNTNFQTIHYIGDMLKIIDKNIIIYLSNK